MRRKHNRKRTVPFPGKRSLAARSETKPVYRAADCDMLTQEHGQALGGNFLQEKGMLTWLPAAGLPTEAETNIT